ncbi:hypothetical protein [Nocardia carnea]|uniref:hypothetical protein n=1 Tax=Nocardia carnea TaxID=37328 RepID=UPI003D787AB6
MFIAAAFAGLAILRPGDLLFSVVQLAGAGFLMYLGSRFLRAESSPLELRPAGRSRRGWWKLAGIGYGGAPLNTVLSGRASTRPLPR